MARAVAPAQAAEAELLRTHWQILRKLRRRVPESHDLSQARSCRVRDNNPSAMIIGAETLQASIFRMLLPLPVICALVISRAF